MKKIFLILFLFTLNISAQEKFTIAGTIKDSSTGETLIGVNIYDKDNFQGTVSNEYGFYSFTLTKGTHNIEISYLGYNTISKTIDLKNNQTLNISLEESAESLNEVVITSTSEKISIKKAEMSVNKMKAKTIKEIPAILGEVDVLKAITTLPGVTTAGEGQSGFNVRGGAADQNLVLLDEATLFNTSHLFGLFSVINADAIKDLKLYKGGTPSKFGGRIASVLDVRQKDGNKYEFHGNGGIGSISSRLTLEGPIVKEKISFFLSGRRSYADLFIPLVIPDNENKAFFYDLNTKLNWEIDDKNKLYLSGYFGKDVFSLSDSFVNNYGNAVGNIRWNHVFNNQLFSNLSLIYSEYYYGLELDFVGFTWDSGLQNVNLKYDLKQYFNDNVSIEYGINSIFHEFNPGKIEPNREDSGIDKLQLSKKYAIESGLYMDVSQKINKKIDLRYGVRLSGFARMGEKNKNIYENNNPVDYDRNTKIYTKAEPISQENISVKEIVKTYFNIEPRFSIAYSLNNSSSLKASYQRMSQYLHLISNTQSPSPLDIWAPSGEHIKPQLSDQIAFGYNYDFNKSYSLVAEVFGKTVENRLDYIDGADLVAQEAIESVVLGGTSRAYGLELQFKKEVGQLSGWISYTLSRSEQQTLGRTDSEIGINNSDWYSTGYDKTHDLSILASYKASEKWNFSSNFTLQSGQPVTYSTGSYEVLGIKVPDYGLRNNFRLPVYHRLDVSATYKPSKYKNKQFKGEWVFGVYNLYNRQNTSSILYSQDAITGRSITEKLSIFGLIPSVTYNFKF